MIAHQDGELTHLDEQLIVEFHEDIVLLQDTGRGAVGHHVGDHETGPVRQTELGGERGRSRHGLDAEKGDGFPGEILGGAIDVHPRCS